MGIEWRRAWMAGLAPRGEVGLGDAASPPATVEDAVTRVGAGPVCWAIELSAAVVGRIVGEVPALGGGPAAVRKLRRSNEANTLHALFTLARGPRTAPPVAEVILEGVREFVHRAVPLEQLLHGVRVGHAATTEAFLRACAELADARETVDEVTAVTRELFSYVNDLSDTMIRTYLAEHEVWSTSAAAARADLVRSLLDDGPPPDVAEASRVLGYDLRRTHRAVVLWTDAPDAGAGLQAAAHQALRSLDATTTLAVPVASGRLWAWGTVPSDGGRRPGGWDALTRRLAEQHLHAAFGTAGDGVTGFRRSHTEALRAQRLDRLRRESGRAPRHATAYADVAAVALLATDLDAAGEFVRRELGGLCARTEPMRALRTTLYHYLDAERSLADVARRLHVARGTVTYRVRRAQEVLGRDLEDDRFALHAALALVEELGDAVLLPRGAEER